MNQALQEAQKENPITTQSLLIELQAALDDFFLVQTLAVGNGLRLQFPNGQRFKISVKEE